MSTPPERPDVEKRIHSSEATALCKWILHLESQLFVRDAELKGVRDACMELGKMYGVEHLRVRQLETELADARSGVGQSQPTEAGQ